MLDHWQTIAALLLASAAAVVTNFATSYPSAWGWWLALAILLLIQLLMSNRVVNTEDPARPRHVLDARLALPFYYALSGVFLYRAIMIGSQFINLDSDLLRLIAVATASLTVAIAAANGFAAYEMVHFRRTKALAGALLLVLSGLLLAGIVQINFALFDSSATDLDAPLQSARSVVAACEAKLDIVNKNIEMQREIGKKELRVADQVKPTRQEHLDEYRRARQQQDQLEREARNIQTECDSKEQSLNTASNVVRASRDRGLATTLPIRMIVLVLTGSVVLVTFICLEFAPSGRVRAGSDLTIELPGAEIVTPVPTGV